MITKNRWTKTFEFIKWTASISIIIGAITFSVYREASLHFWPFLFFFYAHLVWTLAGFCLKERALLFMNIGLIPLDFYALYIRF